jgi:hypothetical protein
MTTIVDGQAGITFNDASTQGTAGYTGFRNRIINGAMVIDQRNSGSSVTPTANAYTLDRWYYYCGGVASKASVQRNAGSVTPPSGYSNYIGLTSASAYAVSVTDRFGIQQGIEGFNTADLAWGTGNAKTVTLSFWVYSSLTGTFGGIITNDAGTQYYVYSYTINAANTWQQQTITIPGSTSGVWRTDNGGGVYVQFSIGAGSTYLGTPGSWGSTLFFGPVGQTSVVGTNGATWYATGVQFEVGGVATQFERRIYPIEYAMCQRYLYKLFCDSASGNTFFMQGSFTATTSGLAGASFPQRMRAVPTIYQEGAVANFALYAPNGGAYSALSSLSLNGVTSTTYGLLSCGIASGGTAGQGTWLAANSQTLYGLGFQAEL